MVLTLKIKNTIYVYRSAQEAGRCEGFPARHTCPWIEGLTAQEGWRAWGDICTQACCGSVDACTCENAVLKGTRGHACMRACAQEGAGLRAHREVWRGV